MLLPGAGVKPRNRTQQGSVPVNRNIDQPSLASVGRARSHASAIFLASSILINCFTRLPGRPLYRPCYGDGNGHQDISVYPPARLLTRFSHRLKPPPASLLVGIDRLALVSPHHHVIRRPAILNANHPRHRPPCSRQLYRLSIGFPISGLDPFKSRNSKKTFFFLCALCFLLWQSVLVSALPASG
jgi:hypothetical protein